MNSMFIGTEFLKVKHLQKSDISTIKHNSAWNDILLLKHVTCNTETWPSVIWDVSIKRRNLNAHVHTDRKIQIAYQSRDKNDPGEAKEGKGL